jgi:formate dehydrogenase subunit delta
MSHERIEKYARMANQIGDYFATQPHEDATAGVADHIRKFWTPKMIAETLDALAQGKITLNETSGHGFVMLQKQAAPAV